jgi:hypothetical protein
VSALLLDKVLMALQNARTQVRVLGTPTDDVNNAVLTELAEAIGLLDCHSPDADGFFYWDVRLGIHKTWVADGADMTDDRVQDILEHHLGYARSDELKAQVLRRPSDKAVAAEMGYRTVKEYLHDRGK